MRVSDNRQAIGSRMGADVRTGDVAEMFGQHSRPNDRVGPQTLARRWVFQIRGMTVESYYKTRLSVTQKLEQ